MIKQSKLIDVISGRQRGVLAWFLKGLLWCFTPVYRVGLWSRNRKFNAPGDNHAITTVSVPVISIGNITTGGTGKTPMVIWICQLIRQHNHRVSIISRGYGAGTTDGRTSGPNDEAMEMDQRLPDVPHLQNPDRVKMAEIAIQELETECIVMDDGFQHRPLGRDLDIVLIDATNPFGYGHLIPRGLLREPLSSLRRADIVAITRCNLVDPATIKSITTTIQPYTTGAAICKTETFSSHWYQHDGQQHPLSHLTGKDVLVCCAIGNPGSFVGTIINAGAAPVEQQFFPDHHLYSRTDLETIADAAAASNAAAIVCTHKDLVKIGVNQLRGIPVYALIIELNIISGHREIEKSVSQLFPTKAT